MEMLDSNNCFIVVTKIIEEFLKNKSVSPLIPNYVNEDIIGGKKDIFDESLTVWEKSVLKFLKAYLDK